MSSYCAISYKTGIPLRPQLVCLFSFNLIYHKFAILILTVSVVFFKNILHFTFHFYLFML